MPQESSCFADGDTYEHYVGRWSRRVGVMFLDWFALPSGLKWMDVGCGTGALAETILARTIPIAVTGIEPSEGFLQKARESINDDRVDFKSGNTLSMPVKDAEADVSVARLVLNFVPDKEAALQEFRRVVQPGGTIAAYVWDYSGEMPLMRYFWNAVTELFAASYLLDGSKSSHNSTNIPVLNARGNARRKSAIMAQ
jgi:ubiquinone/menaquinone biosynthesis C-methylase UbiE